jgi:hypothetical protein
LYRAGNAVSFVPSTKLILARCIREKGIELSPEGRAALDFLLRHLLSTISRVTLIGPTGIGKSNLALAIVFAAAAASAFLHWAGCRPARVLYIDGEMSARLSKERIEQPKKRFGRMPETCGSLTGRTIPACRPSTRPMGRSS